MAPGREQLLPYLGTLKDSSFSRPMLIWALGWSGAPDYLPWLIEQMAVPALAREGAPTP